MPFTEEDAGKHKKNLTPKQAKQWARVAESVRKRLMKKGMDEKEAAGEAIKQANGVVLNTNESKGKYSVYSNKQVLDYEVKLVVHQEKAHLVVPVVMMVEGVHNGNMGPIFHSINELGKFPESWNGIPVVIYHPEQDGQAVSANSPDFIDSITVGRVYNTSVEGKKLKAEVWLDEDKLNKVSEKTLEEINDTKEVEVSLGMFTENEEAEGDYNGEKYAMIAHNHRPDHLAILPDQIGACSCKDGCGLGANTTYHGQKLEEIELENIKVLTKKDIEDKQECKIESGGFKDTSAPVVDNSNVIKKEEKKMEVKCTPCVEKKVKELIANSQGRFIDSDKEWLEALSEIQLDKLMPAKTCVDPEEELETDACKKAKKTTNQEEKKPEVIPVVNQLSPEDQAALAYGRKQLKERKDSMISGI